MYLSYITSYFLCGADVIAELQNSNSFLFSGLVLTCYETLGTTSSGKEFLWVSLHLVYLLNYYLLILALTS